MCVCVCLLHLGCEELSGPHTARGGCEEPSFCSGAMRVRESSHEVRGGCEEPSFCFGGFRVRNPCMRPGEVARSRHSALGPFACENLCTRRWGGCEEPSGPYKAWGGCEDPSGSHKARGGCEESSFCSGVMRVRESSHEARGGCEEPSFCSGAFRVRNPRIWPGEVARSRHFALGPFACENLPHLGCEELSGPHKARGGCEEPSFCCGARRVRESSHEVRGGCEEPSFCSGAFRVRNPR